MNFKKLTNIAILSTLILSISACKKAPLPEKEEPKVIENPFEFRENDSLGEIKSEYKTTIIESDYEDGEFRVKIDDILKANKDLKIGAIAQKEKKTKDNLYIYEIDYIGDYNFPSKMIKEKFQEKEVEVPEAETSENNDKIIKEFLSKLDDSQLELKKRSVVSDIRNPSCMSSEINLTLFEPISIESVADDNFMNNTWKTVRTGFLTTFADNNEAILEKDFSCVYKQLENGEKVYFISPNYNFEFNYDSYRDIAERIQEIINLDFKQYENPITLMFPEFELGDFTIKGANIVAPKVETTKTSGEVYLNKPFFVVAVQKTQDKNLIKGIAAIQSIKEEGN